LLLLFVELQLAGVVSSNAALAVPGVWEANPLMALSQAELGPALGGCQRPQPWFSALSPRRCCDDHGNWFSLSRITRSSSRANLSQLYG
jgi:hypothetical protein